MRPLVPLWSRHALWGGLDVALGLSLLLSPPRRLGQPSFAAPKMVADPFPGDPMDGWGLAFFVVGVAILSWRLLLSTSLTRQDSREMLLRLVYVAAAALYAFWAACLLVSAILDDRAALTGPCVYAAVTVGHLLVSVGRVE